MKIYVCEKNPPSFFTAVFDAVRQPDCAITSDGNIQLSIDCEVIKVGEDEEKCGRVISGLAKYDREAVYDVCIVLRSGDPTKEQTAFEYIKRLIERKAPVRNAFNLPEVIEFNDLYRKVKGEAHNMKGFLRFMESEGGVLYAPYSPDNDVTELIMPHFAERFRAERFVIHDLKRKIAGMYDGHEWIIGRAGSAEVYLTEYERAFETLWKKYYKAVNISERPHNRQMRGYMPERYWKFMPEKNNND